MFADTERSRCVQDGLVKRLAKTIACSNGSRVVSDRGWQCVRERSPVADKAAAKTQVERDVLCAMDEHAVADTHKCVNKYTITASTICAC